jgi:hypothetical protein
MLAASNSRLIALTTPAGKRGWLFDAWHGDGDWHRVKVYGRSMSAHQQRVSGR